MKRASTGQAGHGDTARGDVLPTRSAPSKVPLRGRSTRGDERAPRPEAGVLGWRLKGQRSKSFYLDTCRRLQSGSQAT
jgi:hypothetical protein